MDSMTSVALLVSLKHNKSLAFCILKLYSSDRPTLTSVFKISDLITFFLSISSLRDITKGVINSVSSYPRFALHCM